MGLFDLSGKRAFVVGGTRSIGRAIALSLAQAGADVAVAARTEKDLAEIAASIEALNVRAATVALDVSETEKIPRAIEEITEQLGGIDILVNVAGTTIRKPIEEFTTEECDRIMDVNFKGTYFMCQAVGKQMMERQEGKIINIASLATAIGLPKITVYSGSKGGRGTIHALPRRRMGTVQHSGQRPGSRFCRHRYQRQIVGERRIQRLG